MTSYFVDSYAKPGMTLEDGVDALIRESIDRGDTPKVSYLGSIIMALYPDITADEFKALVGTLIQGARSHLDYDDYKALVDAARMQERLF